MKKIASLALCLLLSCTLLTGCSQSSEPFEEKNYTSDTQISGISLAVRDREIQVSPSQDEHVHIQYFENSKEYYQISLSEDNVLTMTSANNKEWTDYFGGKPSEENRVIQLQLPETLLKNLSLSTTNADIVLGSLGEIETINLSSNGGDLSFQPLNVGSGLTLTAKNGNISGEIVGGYDDFAMTCDTKKGECNLPEQKDGGEKELYVFCNNGDVQIEFVK